MRAFILAIVALLLPSVASAENERPTWTLQVDPLTTVIGLVHLQVEGTINDHWSIYAGPSLRFFDSPLTDDPAPDGFGLEAGVRYYFSGTAPEGWWGLIRGVAAQASEGDDSNFAGYVSGLGGYTAIFDGWFVLSGGLGVQYISYKVGDVGTRGVLPAAHTTLGVAF
ncbi:MAG: hypothetical protein ACE366_22470 [Bradymonadia bacterium]